METVEELIQGYTVVPCPSSLLFKAGYPKMAGVGRDVIFSLLRGPWSHLPHLILISALACGAGG